MLSRGADGNEDNSSRACAPEDRALNIDLDCTGPGGVEVKRAVLVPTIVSLLASCSSDVADRSDLYIARGDLAEIRARGVLRVLVPTLREESLPRAGAPETEDREMAELFAERLGVRPEFIAVESRSEIVDLLEWGYGDLVTAQLTVTKSRTKRLRFTQPTATVDEWLVGPKGASDLPRRIEDLAGREVHVRKSSAFAETLREISAARGIAIRIVYVDERLDTETLAYQVSRGKRPLTVLDSNLLSSIETYNQDLERLMILAEGRELAWVVRSGAPELGSAADAFIIEHYLTGHRTDDLTTEGLDAVRRRGSLRVITLNNPVNYFLYRGRQMGFDYEIAKLTARKLGVRLEMVVPPRRDLVFDWLREGRGDVIASTLTVTPERQAYLAFSKPYLFLEELVVQPSDAREKISGIEELRGKTIFAWKSSSHYETLTSLQEELGPFTIEPIPEDVEFEEVLDRVGKGEYPLAVVDSPVLSAELSYRQDVEVAFSLKTGLGAGGDGAPSSEAPPEQKAVAFAVRPDNPELLAFMDEFVTDVVGTLEFNDVRDRYFTDNRGLLRVKERRAAVSGRLSPYDDLFKKYAKLYGLDWRLMAAQAYKESRFDPHAESWVGARGLFQLLPSTGQELGFEDLTMPDEGIHAGIKYMHLLLVRIEPGIELKHRLRFALAAYNAGWGHLEDARRLAAEQGWDPDKWFGNTEKAMLLLSQPRYFARARHGYVRGRETVSYVSDIQNLYDHYVGLVSF
jgi:peptidoglycan lytic transglycosylase F